MALYWRGSVDHEGRQSLRLAGGPTVCIPTAGTPTARPLQDKTHVANIYYESIIDKRKCFMSGGPICFYDFQNVVLSGDIY